MPKIDFKKTLLVVCIVIPLTHLAYVLFGNMARADGGAGTFLTLSNMIHGVTCLLFMWLALLFRSHFESRVITSFLLFTLCVTALSAVCVAIEIPLTTIEGGVDQVIKAMKLCWIAFMSWGFMLMTMGFINLYNRAKLESARDAALEKEKKNPEKQSPKKE